MVGRGRHLDRRRVLCFGVRCKVNQGLKERLEAYGSGLLGQSISSDWDDVCGLFGETGSSSSNDRLWDMIRDMGALDDDPVVDVAVDVGGKKDGMKKG